MKLNSNFMSFIAVTAICFTLFSFKTGNETEMKIGISEEVAALEITSQKSSEQQRIVSAARRVYQGATKVATNLANNEAVQAAVAACVVNEVVSAARNFFGGEMLEVAPDSEELTLLKNNELSKL